MTRLRALLLAVAIGMGGCAGGTGDAGRANADITVLMVGNSHTVGGDLPRRLEAMLRAGYPGKTVAVVVAPDSLFLDEHIHHGPTRVLLESRRWNYVILQAQKYSSSGQYRYSTDEAAALVRMARRGMAVPVLYPEWSRRGVAETDRIFNLHVSIARQEAACIAPVGQAWDIALQRHPALPLYSDDGNHAAAGGAHLTALVLYATLSGQSPAALPDHAFADVMPGMQQRLRQAAEDAVRSTSPWMYCPRIP